MLVPKLRLITVKTDDGQSKCCCGYCVWDTDKEEYVETGYFTEYMKKEECQEAIDFFNRFEIVKVSYGGNYELLYRRYA